MWIQKHLFFFVYLSSLVSIQSSSFLQISCSKLLHRFYLLTCFLNLCPHQYTTSKAMTVSLVPTAIGQTPLKMSESRMIPLPCLKKSGQGRGSQTTSTVVPCSLTSALQSTNMAQCFLGWTTISLSRFFWMSIGYIPVLSGPYDLWIFEIARKEKGIDVHGGFHPSENWGPTLVLQSSKPLPQAREGFGAYVSGRVEANFHFGFSLIATMTEFHVLNVLNANGFLLIDGQTDLSGRVHGQAHEPGENAIHPSNVHSVGWWILRTKRSFQHQRANRDKKGPESLSKRLRK